MGPGEQRGRSGATGNPRIGLLSAARSTRPTKVHGPVPWDDVRWWAMRRYRPVRTQGDAAFRGWRFNLPGLCGASLRRDDTFGVIAGQLSLTLRLMTQAELANQERAADDRTGSVTRWAGKELCGVLCQFVLAADFVLVADVAPIDTPPSGTEPDRTGPDRPVHLRLEARSQDRHELHWATAVLHSLRPPAAGPVVNQR